MKLKLDGNKVEDSLEQQKQNFNLGKSVINSRQAMQNLYKLQLDNLVNEKAQIKKQQKQRQMKQKQQYNDRLFYNRQVQKNKQASYKNYYQMVTNNQHHNQEVFISPFVKREQLKEDLISHGLEEERRKIQAWEIEERKRLAQKKNNYRNGLLEQIEERKQKQINNKQKQQLSKQQFRKYSKVPEQISRYERQVRKDQMQKYKEDLDHVYYQKEKLKNTANHNSNLRISEDIHNALINPVPYNIQNPYILREMMLSQNPQQNQNNNHTPSPQTQNKQSSTSINPLYKIPTLF